MGDGAGSLTQRPDALLRQWADGNALTLPPPGDYAVAMCFLPQDARAREEAIGQLERFVEIEGQIMLGWRDVLLDTAGMSPIIVADMPVIRKAIVARGTRAKDQAAFERKLLAIRKTTPNPLPDTENERDP